MSVSYTVELVVHCADRVSPSCLRFASFGNCVDRTDAKRKAERCGWKVGRSKASCAACQRHKLEHKFSVREEE